MIRALTIFCCCLFFQLAFAQQATIKGRIIDAASQRPIEYVTVYLEGSSNATETNESGTFSILVPSSIQGTLVFTRIGYKEVRKKVLLANSEILEMNIQLPTAQSDIQVVVTERKLEEYGIREEVTTLKMIPSASGNFESVLPSIALGTTSGTGGELSSQYNVRGGNYDENLVYVNDFAIYRPQLIREGQQEGLTFPNIDLIRDLKFSSGGFAAKYGDKMSSVLDVRYKRPDSMSTSLSFSLLGASMHTEGSLKVGKSNYRRFRYLLGARYKTNRYLLGSLDLQGEYVPNFYDVQGYFTFDITKDLQVGLLTNYNRSEYSFVPSERSTGLGLVDFALELNAAFEGQELNDFTTGMTGLAFTYIPEHAENPTYLKLLASGFQSLERETYDIIGDYRLSQVENDITSEDFGDEIALIGSGTQHLFARNRLFANIYNITHKGGIEFDASTEGKVKSHFLQWGTEWQHERIDDKIKEWERLDSAGFSLPFDEEAVRVFSSVRSENEISSNRFTGFLQHTYSIFRDSLYEFNITGGLRAAYWDLNKELLLSPRLQIAFKPLKSSNDISYRIAGGLYQQPAFYRELRRLDGTVNRDLKAQKSLHLLAGITYDFYVGKSEPKPFRLIAEVYYKSLWDLVSYEIDNVRIRYSGENDATGYVTGLDLRLNGEFVPGAESWVNLSLLRARESLNGVTHMRRELGQPEGEVVEFAPRPSDRLLTFAMFFQDYLPQNENFKMHLQMTFGTGFPFGLRGNNDVYRNTYRFPTYQRIDLGFSFQLWKREWISRRPNHFLRPFKNVWCSFEVFNLMDVKNASAQSWIKAINGQQFAIPNFLTTRRLNFRMRFEI